MTDVHDPVEIGADRTPNLSPNTIRAVEKGAGQKFGDLMGDDAYQASRFQVMAFAELYRRYNRLGHMPDAATLWEEAGDLEIQFVLPSTADPLDDGPSTISPPSAGTGA